MGWDCVEDATCHADVHKDLLGEHYNKDLNSTPEESNNVWSLHDDGSVSVAVVDNFIDSSGESVWVYKHHHETEQLFGLDDCPLRLLDPKNDTKDTYEWREYVRQSQRKRQILSLPEEIQQEIWKKILNECLKEFKEIPHYLFQITDVATGEVEEIYTLLHTPKGFASYFWKNNNLWTKVWEDITMMDDDNYNENLKPVRCANHITNFIRKTNKQKREILKENRIRGYSNKPFRELVRLYLSF